MQRPDTAASPEKIPLFDARTGTVGQVERVVKTAAEWKRLLTPEQYRITREQGTEQPFSGTCAAGTGDGVYVCVCCATHLFAVTHEFSSGTGWPSFWEPVSSLNITLLPDTSRGMDRVEVRCARCGAHLGHVFDDGPPPTGKRYCINAAALVLMKVPEKPKVVQTATFAAGCFWGAEEAFRTVPGVLWTRVGYTGGLTENPTYEEVCTDTTGHAEAVEVVYDPSIVSYGTLLALFWQIHDPTTTNRQGPDVGTQYRAVIFYRSAEEKKQAERSRDTLQHSAVFAGRRIVTQIRPAGIFYPADDYHQRYLYKKGAAACHQ